MASEVACGCEEWRVNLPKINGPVQLQTIRSGFRYQFDGVPFRYCPWCGKNLIDLKEAITAVSESDVRDR